MIHTLLKRILKGNLVCLLNRQSFVLLLLWTLSSMFLRQGGRWSNKTGNILTDLCLDVFRFLSLTMKVNLSGQYTVFICNRTYGYQ